MPGPINYRSCIIHKSDDEVLGCSGILEFLVAPSIEIRLAAAVDGLVWLVPQ